jgi:hypothetical protein
MGECLEMKVLFHSIPRPQSAANQYEQAEILQQLPSSRGIATITPVNSGYQNGYNENTMTDYKATI